MADLYVPVVAFLNTVAAVLGGYILFRTLGAYRRFGSRPMLYLSIAIGLLTLGFILEGFLYEFVKLPLVESQAGKTIVNLAAFSVLIYSLVAERTTPEDARVLEAPEPEA